MSLHTAGKKYQTLDGVEYIGFYHKVRDKLFTGKRHVFKVSKQLRQIIQQNNQGETYYSYALKYKDKIEGMKLKQDEIQQGATAINFRTVDYPVTLNLLKSKISNAIYIVDIKTFTKFKEHIMVVSQSLILKNPAVFSNIIYNKNRIKRIKDNDIRKFVQSIF